MRSILPAIRAVLEEHYAIPVTGVERLWSGTTGVHARATSPGGAVFAKTYALRADFAYEQLNIDIVRAWGRAGIPAPTPLPATAGGWIHRQPGLALSAWEWVDGVPASTLTVARAEAVGRALAQLHRFLDDAELPNLRVNREHSRYTPADVITDRFQRLLYELRLSPHTATKAATLEQVRRRLDQLRHLPALRDGLPAARLDRVHGDVASPNLLFHGERLSAILDPRVQLADRARELGRIAFDPHTVANYGDWPQVGLALVAAYLDADGPMPASEVAASARLALLHAMTSTYPLAESLTRRDPPRVRTQQARYWSDRAVTVDRLLAQLPGIEDRLAALTVQRDGHAAGTGGRR